MNAEVQLPLERMTIAEKLAVIDAVWQDLKQNSERIPVPEWHKQILENRKRSFQQGAIEYSDWEEAKAEIRRRVS